MSLRTLVLLPLFLLLAYCAIEAAPVSAPIIPTDVIEGQIVINNRLLARVNDKTITVYDVVKKIDLFLSSHYPEVMKSSSNRYQFYAQNWKAMLERMIDDQLILSDAEGKDIKITEGDIRQAILDRLGPNVMTSLDKLGLTFDEARKMIHEEMIVHRMMGAKVHSKAFQGIGPELIKAAYKEHLAEQNVGEEWQYQVVSIRSPNEVVSQQLARQAYLLLTAAKSGPESLATALKKLEQGQDPDFAVNVSQLLVANEKTISEAHRKGLTGLQAGMYSQPIVQSSGSDKTPVQRIFFLKSHETKAPPAFGKVASALRDRLLDTAVSEEEQAYKIKLRRRFSYDKLHLEEIPSDFQPFSYSYK